MQELLRGASIALSLKILAAGLAFGLNVVIARTLGADDAGLFFLSLILVTIAATLGQAGTEGALVRFISASHTEDNWSKIKGIYKQSLLLTIGSSLVLSMALFFSAPILANKIFDKPELEVILQIMSIAITPYALYSMHSAALQGLKKIRDANIVLGILAPAFTLAGCAILLPDNGVVGAGTAYVFSAVLTMIVGIFFWRSHISIQKNTLPVFDFKILVKSAYPLLGVTIFQLILMCNATLLLGLWSTESEVAVFHAANRVAMLTSFILMAVNSILAPKLSACFANHDRALASSLIKKSTGLMIVFSAPLLLVMIIFPYEIMAIFGEDFRAGADLLIILAVAQFINVITGAVGLVLIMSGNEVKLRHAFFIAAIASLVFGIALIHEFGSIGAAFSMAIGIVLVNLLAAYFVVRHAKVNIFFVR